MQTILLMEDDPHSARLTTRLLEREGLRVIAAVDGESGLRAAQECRPDLILLDLGLPDMDGQTVAALLRGMPELAQVPIIAVTAWPLDTARQMAEAYGCNDYISKPIKPLEFVARVTSLLRKTHGANAPLSS